MIISVKTATVFIAFLSSLVYSASAGMIGGYNLVFASVVIVLFLTLHIVYVKNITWLMGLFFHMLIGLLIGTLAYETTNPTALIFPTLAAVTAYLISISDYPIENSHSFSIFKKLSLLAAFLCLLSIFYPDPYRSGLWTSIFSKPNNFGMFLVTTSMLLYLGNLSGKLGTLLLMSILILISLMVGSRAATFCMMLLFMGYLSRIPASNFIYFLFIGIIFIALTAGIELSLFSAFEEKLARRGGFWETQRLQIWGAYLLDMNWIGQSQGLNEIGLHSSWLWLAYHMGIVPGVYFSLLIIVMVKKRLSALGIFSKSEVMIFLLIVLVMATIEVIFFKPFYVFLLFLFSTSSKTSEIQSQTKPQFFEQKTASGIL